MPELFDDNAESRYYNTYEQQKQAEAYDSMVEQEKIRAEAEQEERQADIQKPLKQQNEDAIRAGTEQGPTLEQSEVEKEHQKYQDDPNVEMINGKPFNKPQQGNAADAFMDYTGDAVEMMAQPGRGVLDTIVDATRLIPYLDPLNEAYDQNFGRQLEKDPAKKIVRDISATLVPTLVLGGVASNAISKAGVASRNHLLTRIATDAALGTAVTAVSEQTTEPGNFADLINPAFKSLTGVDIPWSHRDGDSPDWTYIKNMIDDGLFNVAGGALEAFVHLKRQSKFLPKDEVSAEYLTRRTQPMREAIEELGDPVSGAVKVNDDLRDAEVASEAAERLRADPEGLQYDAFLNEPHEASERSVKNYTADPVNFKEDHARIQLGLGTTDGRERPAITPGAEKFLMTDDFREQTLNEIGEVMETIKFDTVIGDTVLTEADKAKAIDNLVDKAANLNGLDFGKAVEQMRSAVNTIYDNPVKYLSSDDANTGLRAMDRMLEILNPRHLTGSVVAAQQAANGIADSAATINLIGNSSWTGRQQEQLLKNFPILMQEVRAHQYIQGYTLNMLKMVKDAKNKGIYNAEWVNQANEKFAAALKGTREDALVFANELFDISQENPEYLKPLYKQYMKTNGDIDSIYKLNKLMENRMGLIKKSFGIGDKKIPSIFIKEAESLRYNNLLNAMAPLRAASGAAINLVSKPVSVISGFAAQGDLAGLKKSLKMFGGMYETFSRGLKYAGDEWRYAVKNPDFAMARGREDFKPGTLEDFETMKMMEDAWEANGDIGKLWTSRFITGLAWWNRWYPNRLGVNALTAVDGFVKSVNASMIARGRAYEEVFDKDVFDEALFQKKQQELYSSMFDKDGLMTDEAAKYSSAEMNLNLSNDIVSSIENITSAFPIVKSLFLFPRTGANAVQLVSTYNPMGPLGLAMGKARKALNAETIDEINEVLVQHGYKPDDMAAFRTIKADYVGRQNMSSLIVSGIGLAAFYGKITGNGPADHGERKRMIAQGWQPLSILIGENEDGSKNWLSYRGVDILETLMGMTSDIVMESTKVDRDADAWFHSLAGAISMNITNKTFLSGFEPVVSMLSGDEAAMNRFAANNVDAMIPGAGVRGILSRTLVPQLKDVENNFLSYMAHRNRWIPGLRDQLVDQLDIYTGEPINYTVPIINHLNGLLPFFKVNAGLEKWRQNLNASGWDGKRTLITNPDTKEKYTPAERQFMNNWIAKNSNLGAQVQEIFEKDDGWWKKTLDEFTKARPALKLGPFPVNLGPIKPVREKEMSIKDVYLYEHLDRIHNTAMTNAHRALMASTEDLGRKALLRSIIDQQVQQGEYDNAATAVVELRKFNNP
jgi:hypothetical protein